MLERRLDAFWLPDETVLYVGKAATSVREQVDQYLWTQLGDRSPHAGGWFLKVHANREKLFLLRPHFDTRRDRGPHP